MSSNAAGDGAPFRFRRRAFVAGGVAAIVAGLEYASLRGSFDHRRAPGAESRERYAASRSAVDSGESGIIHIAHSTHLLALDKTILLTDPWFYDPAFGALSHQVKPAVSPSELGPLGAILISHDHPDHADFRAMDQMDKRAVAIVATRELAARMRQRGFSDVCVLETWQERVVGAVTVTAVPALHDIHEVGFVVRGAGKSVYFAGDTAVHPALPALAERFRPDVSILPVDGTRLTGGGLHVMTPDDAVSAAQALGSKLVLPSHAEASFSDPFVEAALASTVPHAQARFAELVAQRLPDVVCGLPPPGALVRV